MYILNPHTRKYMLAAFYLPTTTRGDATARGENLATLTHTRAWTTRKLVLLVPSKSWVHKTGRDCETVPIVEGTEDRRARTEQATLHNPQSPLGGRWTCGAHLKRRTRESFIDPPPRRALLAEEGGGEQEKSWLRRQRGRRRSEHDHRRARTGPCRRMDRPGGRRARWQDGLRRWTGAAVGRSRPGEGREGETWDKK